MQCYTVYFIWKLLNMFRVIPPPIIRSAYNCYLQHLVFVTPLLLPAAIVEELEPVWVCSRTLKPVPTLVCMNCLFCVVFCIVCVYMCTILLPPGGYPIAVKYIIYHKPIKTARSHLQDQSVYASEKGSRYFCDIVWNAYVHCVVKYTIVEFCYSGWHTALEG